jgi:hypothetical protein
VDIDQFWSLIESARSAAGDRLHPEFEDRFLTGLEVRMDALALDELIEYDARRIELYEQADVPGLRAVNRMVDSTVEYLPEPCPAFLSGLVSLGRVTFERALADADSLLWDPLVRAIAAGQLAPDRMLLREMAAMAGYNYEYRLDDVVDFPALVGARVTHDEAETDSEDEEDNDSWNDDARDDDPWAEDAWDEDAPDDDPRNEDSWDEDPAEVRRRLPRLNAIFAARMEAAEQDRMRRRRSSIIGWAALYAAIVVVLITIVVIMAAVQNTA